MTNLNGQNTTRPTEWLLSLGWQHAAIGLVLVSADGRVLAVNPRLRDLFHLPPDQPAPDTHWDAFSRAALLPLATDPPALEQQWGALAAAGQAAPDQVMILRDHRCLVVDYTPVRSGSMRGALWQFRDVTAYQHAADRRSKALIAALLANVTRARTAESDALTWADHLEMLQQAELSIAQKLTLDHVLAVALDYAVKLSGASTGFIALGDELPLRVVRSVGAYRQFTGTLPAPAINQQRGVVGRAMRERRPQYVPDVKADPDYMATIPATRAQITLPLIEQGDLIGVLNLESTRTDRFTRPVFEVLKLLARRIVAALENARLYEMQQSHLARLQYANQKLSELEQLKTQMIRVASHDIRSPLGIVKAYVTLLYDDLGSAADDFQPYFDAMNRAIDRMQQMTTDVLSLERIHAAQANTWEPVNLRPLVERAFQEHRAASDQRGVRYTLALPPGDKLTVSCEPVQLYEAITNLISNAIKYTLPGGSVQVRLEADNRQIRLLVIDSGIGIPEEFHDKLFDPFFRVKSSETQTIDGTGLGLYLVKSIIDRHDGEMIFNSVHGQGSTFGFTLSLLVQ